MTESFQIKAREPLTEILLESIESSKFVSHKARISRESGSRKDSQPTKSERNSQKLLKLNFRDFCDSELSGLLTFDNMASSASQIRFRNWKGRL